MHISFLNKDSDLTSFHESLSDLIIVSKNVEIETTNKSIIFVDTPGLFKPRRRLDRAMVAAAWGGAADADVIVLLIEANRGVTDGVEKIVLQHPGGSPH